MANLEQIKYNIRVQEHFYYIEEALKKYGLIDVESKAFEHKLLQFSYKDIELPDTATHKQRVSLWMNFLTTMCKWFGVEPVLITETGSVPNVYQLVITLQGADYELCEDCAGTGNTKRHHLDDSYVCPKCYGLGINTAEVIISEDD